MRIPVDWPGKCVEENEACDEIRMLHRKVQTDGPAPVCHHQRDVLQSQLMQQLTQPRGMSLRRPFFRSRVLVRQAEAEMVNGYAPIVLAQG